MGLCISRFEVVRCSQQKAFVASFSGSYFADNNNEPVQTVSACCCGLGGFPQVSYFLTFASTSGSSTSHRMRVKVSSAATSVQGLWLLDLGLWEAAVYQTTQGLMSLKGAISMLVESAV